MAFDLGAMTIDPLSSAYDPRPLIPYLKELNVPYLYEEQVIIINLENSFLYSLEKFVKKTRKSTIPSMQKIVILQ